MILSLQSPPLSSRGSTLTESILIFFLRCTKSLADAFLARDLDHIWLAHDRRSGQHIRDPLIVRQRPNTNLARRARRRDEDLPRAMRQNGRCAILFPLPLLFSPTR